MISDDEASLLKQITEEEDLGIDKHYQIPDELEENSGPDSSVSSEEEQGQTRASEDG